MIVPFIVSGKRLLLISIFFFAYSSFLLYAQPFEQSRKIDGLRNKDIQYIALHQCTVITEPGKILQNATIIIHNRKIESIGIGIPIPSGATIKNMKGAWIYPGFIESYSNAGMNAAPSKRNNEDEDELEKPGALNRGAFYWNEAIKPEFRAASFVGIDDKTATEMHKNGFTMAHVNSMDGIMRGSSAIVLAKSGAASDITVKSDISQWLSFRKGNSRNAYPSSLMGSIALIRQAFYDAQWYGQTKKQGIEINLTLESLANVLSKKTPIVFEAGNEHGMLRASKIANEFGLQCIYYGSGKEYRRLSSIQSVKPTIILPINFPAVPDVSTLQNAAAVSLSDLKAWDAAPANPGLLDSVSIPFCLTANGLKDKSAFLKNIRKAIKYGLKSESALAALTTVPAKLWGIQDIAGTISPGKLANLIIADDNIFEKGTIRSVYTAGEEDIISPFIENDIRGYWRLIAESMPVIKCTINGKAESPECSANKDSLKISVKFSNSGKNVQFSFNGDSLHIPGLIRFSGIMDSLNARGTALLPTGREIGWTAVRDSSFIEKKSEEKDNTLVKPSFAIMSPDEPFGFLVKPQQKTVLFRNATIWTAAKDGILKNSDILISEGKIINIGKDLPQKADTIIDATDKHISPGIIDEHSHIAIESGVNEGTHAITAEVHIGDVLQPDDINIYRQLAGGVTASHLLHGSANPIGGQLQLIKLRWGEDADNLKMNFPGTIKFALGENVKQANWGDKFSSRYPQTRMGVEEIMRDGFRAALEYEKAWSDFNANPGIKVAPRKDIQLDILLEIIRSKRFIHCHSYVQSEILMLIRLAEEFKFKINTFTHILEGYKVAKEMSEHGVGGSSFADWWAYKFEVFDAIPQNSGIMHEQGITVAINSDDAEMARRLNQEAGKSVKYGNVPEEEAIKFVTINPAKLLKVDNSIGSLEIGKDADLVVWSANPLSNFSKPEQTYIDGKCYFDRKTDELLRKRDAAMRASLEQKAIEFANNGETTRIKTGSKKHLYDCEDIFDEVAGSEE